MHRQNPHDYMMLMFIRNRQNNIAQWNILLIRSQYLYMFTACKTNYFDEKYVMRQVYSLEIEFPETISFGIVLGIVKNLDI